MKAETKGLIAGAVGLAGLAITGVATRSSTGPIRGLAGSRTQHRSDVHAMLPVLKDLAKTAEREVAQDRCADALDTLTTAFDIEGSIRTDILHAKLVGSSAPGDDQLVRDVNREGDRLIVTRGRIKRRCFRSKRR